VGVGSSDIFFLSVKNGGKEWEEMGRTGNELNEVGELM